MNRPVDLVPHTRASSSHRVVPHCAAGPKAIVDRALQRVKAGDIILMHDIHPDSIRAIPDLVAGLQKKGMELVTVSELMRSRPNTTAEARAR